MRKGMMIGGIVLMSVLRMPLSAHADVTQVQARDIALNAVPGKIIRTDYNDAFYQFRILTEEDRMQVVIVDIASGAVVPPGDDALEIAPAPPPLQSLSQKNIEDIALRYVDEAVQGKQKPELRGTELTLLEDGRPVYEVKVRKQSKVYKLLVHAINGQIIQAEPQ